MKFTTSKGFKFSECAYPVYYCNEERRVHNAAFKLDGGLMIELDYEFSRRGFSRRGIRYNIPISHLSKYIECIGFESEKITIMQFAKSVKEFRYNQINSYLEKFRIGL